MIKEQMNIAGLPALHCTKPTVGSSTVNKKKPVKMDYYLSRFKWYRKFRKCTWYKHQFTNDALQLSYNLTGTFWALYDNINRYSNVIEIESW